MVASLTQSPHGRLTLRYNAARLNEEIVKTMLTQLKASAFSAKEIVKTLITTRCVGEGYVAKNAVNFVRH